jgi:glycosyltransferase involved in cell wall biosynthesis
MTMIRKGLDMVEKILVFIPVYNCQDQIGRVLKKLSTHQDVFSEILIVDNRSPDQTIENAKSSISECGLKNVTILKNDQNYSLGGSHKVAFQYAIDHQFDFLCVYHGDDQADINDIVPLIKEGIHHQYDCMLGARFHKNSKLIGYSKFRIFGNIVLNYVCSIPCRKKILDQGSGLNFYKVSFLQDKRIWSFPDNLTFNVYLLFHAYFTKALVSFFPITWREEDQISNAKVMKQGWHILKLSLAAILRPGLIYDRPRNQHYSSEKI